MTTRNDATRLRIKPKDPRRLRQVVARQGQVLLDADLEQAQRLVLDRVDRGDADQLGSPGRLVCPAGTPGFRVDSGGAPTSFTLRAGWGYLGGWLVETAADCTLATQPHPRQGDAATLPGVVVLKVVQRFVDPVEEPVFADKGLGDAQAAGRSLLDWQVLPYPTNDPDRLYWLGAARGTNGRGLLASPFGFQTTRLDGTIKVVPGGTQGLVRLIWQPSEMAQRFLASAKLHLFGQRQVQGSTLKEAGWTPQFFERILCRLRLRAAHIWSEDKQTKARTYLNAEHLGTRDQTTGRALLVERRDVQRAADLEMFFYLSVDQG